MIPLAREGRRGVPTCPRGPAALFLIAMVLLAGGCSDRSGSSTATTVLPPGSAQASVERLWQWTESGSPRAMSAYDGAVVQDLGKTNVVAALETLQSQFQSAPPQLVDSEPTPMGTQVTVRQVEPGNPPRDSAYLLERKDGSWIVTFDGLLSQAFVSDVAGAAVTAAQKKIDPSVKEPSTEAQLAGSAAGIAAQDQVYATVAPRSAIPVPSAKSPQAAVRRIQQWIRAGSPAAMSAYDTETVSQVGAVNMLSSLQPLGSTLNEARLHTTGTEKTDLGTIITFTLIPEEKGVQRTESSYLLVERGPGWIIAVDGLLDRVLVSQANNQAIQQVEQATSNPSSTKVSPEAAAAGEAAAQKEQDLLLKLVPAQLKSQLNPFGG